MWFSHLAGEKQEGGEEEEEEDDDFMSQTWIALPYWPEPRVSKPVTTTMVIAMANYVLGLEEENPLREQGK